MPTTQSLAEATKLLPCTCNKAEIAMYNSCYSGNIAHFENCQSLRRTAVAEALDAAKPKWLPMETAPQDGKHFLAVVEGMARRVAWGKTSHIPLYGFCLADQGAEEFDLCEPSAWQPLPEPPPSDGGK